jgi:hypothetical protein
LEDSATVIACIIPLHAACWPGGNNMILTPRHAMGLGTRCVNVTLTRLSAARDGLPPSRGGSRSRRVSHVCTKVNFSNDGFQCHTRSCVTRRDNLHMASKCNKNQWTHFYSQYNPSIPPFNITFWELMNACRIASVRFT